MTKRLVGGFMLFLLWIIPVWAQDANAPQDVLPQTYTEVATLGRGKVIEARWRSDGQAFLVSTHLGGWLYSADFTLLHHFPGIGQSALSSDGHFVATVTVTPYQLHIWDAESYARIRAFDLGIDPEWKKGNTLAWSPDSSHIAIVAANKPSETGLQSVEIFNVSPGQHVRSFDVATYITHLTWRPDGQRLAISQIDLVQIIDPFHTQDDTTIAVKSDSPITMALWSPDQETLVTLWINYGHSGNNNNVRFWTEDGKTLKFVFQEPWTTALAWSPDGRMIATGITSLRPDGPVYHSMLFWDTQTGEVVDYIPKYEEPYLTPFLSVEWSPDGKQILTASADNVVRVYDWPLSRKKPRELVAGQDPITSLAWNAEGTQIVSTSEDGNVLIQDVATGTPLDRLKAPEPRLKAVAWNSLTNQIAFGTNATTVYTWDIGAAKPLGMRSLPRDRDSGFPEIAALAYSPDGQWLAGATSDYPISVWLTDNSDNTRTLGPLPHSVLSLAWSADNRKLAYNSTLAHVYDLESERTQSFECEVFGSTNIIMSVALSPDGQFLAAANSELGVCLWEIKTGQLVKRLQFDAGNGPNYPDILYARKLTWSPDGSRLALISQRFSGETLTADDDFVEVWSVPAGERLALIEQTTPPTDIAWSPDSTRLAVGDSDGLIHIWQQP